MEEKRFALAYEQGNWWAVRDGDITLWKEEVIYLLNKQQATVNRLEKENDKLKQELKGMDELLQSYRKTIKHDAELLADASKNGYLPPLEGIYDE